MDDNKRLEYEKIAKFLDYRTYRNKAGTLWIGHINMFDCENFECTQENLQEMFDEGHLDAWFIPEGHIGFETDWNQLMEVVDKIETIYDDHHGFFGVYISSDSCCIQGTKLDIALNPDIDYDPVYWDQQVLDNKIHSTYKAVVNFITWRELQNTK
jgi:hypothetical protein